MTDNNDEYCWTYVGGENGYDEWWHDGHKTIDDAIKHAIEYDEGQRGDFEIIVADTFLFPVHKNFSQRDVDDWIEELDQTIQEEASYHIQEDPNIQVPDEAKEAFLHAVNAAWDLMMVSATVLAKNVTGRRHIKVKNGKVVTEQSGG